MAQSGTTGPSRSPRRSAAHDRDRLANRLSSERPRATAGQRRLRFVTTWTERSGATVPGPAREDRRGVVPPLLFEEAPAGPESAWLGRPGRALGPHPDARTGHIRLLI